MAKYTGSVCRICRREGAKLFLKGDRCMSPKCALVKRAKAPGQHGAMRKKNSEYGIQLREKQKVKKTYGLLEKQFVKYYEKAESMKGPTGENMLVLLERRLDNVIYRMGIGASRAQARQMVNHGLITVDGKRVNIPSYLVSAGEVIAVKDNKKDKACFAEIKGANGVLPKWLDFNFDTFEGKIIELPKREDVDLEIQERLIVELYSR